PVKGFCISPRRRHWPESWVFPLVRSATGLFISSTVSSIGSTSLGSHAGLSCSKAPSITGSSITPLATAMLLSSLQFGVSPATLFQKIRRTVTKLPEQLRPKRILFWDVKPETSLGTFRMAIEKLSDIPADRPLTLAERKALLKEMQDARGRLICAESILEVAIEGCKDELKKRIAATVRAHEKGLSVAHACRLMGLSRSTFYASQKTTPAQIKTDELAEKISEVRSSCFFTIGRRRLTARIRQVRKAKPCAGKATRQQLPDNLLNREFQADRPMHRLVTDVTYVPYFENDEWHWGYLSLVQDLFNRAIVAWVYSKKQDVRLGLATLRLLSGRGLAPGAMLHSGRGSIYTAQAFRDAADGMGLTQSFSRTANCHDNATMECFNGTFKVEALYNPALTQDRPSFKAQNDYIGRYVEFYNNERPCSVIDNQTPAAYRMQFYGPFLRT
ncbi:IS3 family transposase, partial [Sutterella wadsworthensis]